jgi:hypothetical protein
MTPAIFGWEGSSRVDVDGRMRRVDRCGKLSSRQGPEFPQAGHGFASGSVKIEPDPDPPDEPLGPLRGPGER